MLPACDRLATVENAQVLTGLEVHQAPLPVVLQTVIENVRVVGPPGFWVVAPSCRLSLPRLQRECEEIAA
jgi:hypothetical protein